MSNEVQEETRAANSVLSFAKPAPASRAELVPTRLSTADQEVSSAHDVQPAQGISVGTEALLSGGAGRCSTTNAKLQDSQSGLDVNVRSEASVAGSKHYVREPRQVSSDPSSFIAAPCSSPSVVAAPCSVASERRQETDGKCLRSLRRSYALINRGSGAGHPGIRRSAGCASKERDGDRIADTWRCAQCLRCLLPRWICQQRQGTSRRDALTLECGHRGRIRCPVYLPFVHTSGL